MMATSIRTMLLTSQACGRDGAFEQTGDMNGELDGGFEGEQTKRN
jgi:hypothetical protein